jgi:hypothetical protein
VVRVFLKSLDRFLQVKLISLSNKSAVVLNRLIEVMTMDNAEPSLTVWQSLAGLDAPPDF